MFKIHCGFGDRVGVVANSGALTWNYFEAKVMGVEPISADDVSLKLQEV